MTDWLATTWEASWRPFQYFNLYRLVLAGLALLAALWPQRWTAVLHVADTPLFLPAAGVYLLVVAAGFLASIHWRHRFNFQLSSQVMADAVALGLLMFAGGGVGSGIGTLLLVSLATASLVGRGRLVLFYAALATLVTLGGQVVGVLVRGLEPATIVQAGLLSAGFFATAILARLLGQRLMVNEELARQRGISLENQSRISQRVIERMQDGVLVVGSAGEIERHNPMAAEMLGAAPAPGAQLSGYCPPLAGALADWKASQAVATQEFKPPTGGELRARFEQTSSSAGEVLVFLEDLGRLQERAQQLKLAALGRLTASIAHEIRNPLSAIGHAGELLREERRGAMQERLLKIVADNVARLDRIVADVLELGRRDRMQPEALHLEPFCTHFVDGFDGVQGVAPGIIAVETDGDPVLCFDRTHLHQILWNLLANAVRHASGAPGSVRLRATSAGAGTVELHVIDDGGGVPDEAREQIFEPFFTTHHLGTGLGLFIARELCTANGATLDLAADPGHGHFIIVGRSDT